MSATDQSLTSGHKHNEIQRAIAPQAADPEAAEAAEERKTDRWLLRRISSFLGEPPLEFVVRGGARVRPASAPVARVTFSVGAFFYERDWRYVAVSLVVLALLFCSLFSGHG